MKDIQRIRILSMGIFLPQRVVKNGILLALWFTISLGLAGCQETHQRKVPPLPVETALVHEGDLSLSVDTLGQAVPMRSVTITPQVSGSLLKVYVHSGQWVTQGQPMFSIDPAVYAAAVAQDQANLQGEIAQAHYDALQVQAYKPLVAKDYVTLQTFQEAQATAATAIAAVAADRAALQQARLNLSYTHISAPITGKIGLLTIKSGNLVVANSTVLTTINQTQPIKIQFSLPEQNLGDLRKALAQKGNTVQIWNEDHEKLLGTGPVTAIDNSVNASSATVTAQATIANPQKTIWSGEYLQVSFIKSTLHHVLIIPSLALQEGESGPFVYVIKNGKAVMLSVGFMGQNKNDTAISGAIQFGTVVIVGAPARLRPNADVRAITAATWTPQPHSETAQKPETSS